MNANHKIVKSFLAEFNTRKDSERGFKSHIVGNPKETTSFYSPGCALGGLAIYIYQIDDRFMLNIEQSRNCGVPSFDKYEIITKDQAARIKESGSDYYFDADKTSAMVDECEKMGFLA